MNPSGPEESERYRGTVTLERAVIASSQFPFISRHQQDPLFFTRSQSIIHNQLSHNFRLAHPTLWFAIWEAISLKEMYARGVLSCLKMLNVWVQEGGIMLLYNQRAKSERVAIAPIKQRG